MKPKNGKNYLSTRRIVPGLQAADRIQGLVSPSLYYVATGTRTKGAAAE